MSWLGTGLGAGVGMVLGGPLGAVLGGYLGHAITKKRTEERYAPQQESQQLVFVSLFSMFAKLAKADGVVSSEEVATIKSFTTRAGLDREDQQAALDLFQTAHNIPHSIFDFATQYATLVPQLEMRVMTYRMLWTLAMADNKLHPEEERILKELTTDLNIAPTYFNVFKRELSGGKQSLEEHYALLEISPNSSDEEIKRKYHSICKEYHPDTIQSKGLPKEFLNFATEHLTKVNDAYKTIMDERK